MFSDNPAEDNQTTFDRLVKETCSSSPTSIVNKKKKAKKLAFTGTTIKDSEEEDPNTSSNQMEVHSEVECIPKRGKESAKSPVEQNPQKQVPYPKGKSRYAHDF
ncbi:hypothetical protein O181_062158 [Austropuccinia psidii MF-1]|uniref:Uncharacterized protein n=1 Tax=Austropuccinia psidii MF-1 TaxID=1389203 RepID=A0A9Q3HZ93_9BASI|nr:hypothetical protein [Austropuccinia psidii MF-1]